MADNDIALIIKICGVFVTSVFAICWISIPFLLMKLNKQTDALILQAKKTNQLLETISRENRLPNTKSSPFTVTDS